MKSQRRTFAELAVSVILLVPGAGHGQYQWTNFAGQAGGAGNVNGTGSAARFDGPYGVTVDVSGNVFVADRDNHVIRKITPSGLVTTLAGSMRLSGSTNGTGSAARFNAPEGIAIDGSGNLYIADTENRTIRKITPDGAVTTLAGTAGSSGSTDGTGSTARFNLPRGVAVDSVGNLVVGDSGNHTIRHITAEGVVTTLAGTAGAAGSTDDTGSAARFNQPRGVAIDVEGNLYVADASNHTIRKMTPARVVSTLAGTAGASGSTNATGAAARFSFPAGVSVDSSGVVFVASTSNQSIRRITPAGEVTTFAGTPGLSGSVDGTGAAARFSGPFGVALDSSGNVYVADTSNHTIRHITPAGMVSTFAGSPPLVGSTNGTGGAARFNFPWDVAVDVSGNAYVADTNNHAIRKITPAGLVSTFAGNPGGSPGSINGTGTAARFYTPYGVAVDASGNVYVSDTRNQTIRKITSAGVVTTLAGSVGQVGSADGTGSAARFNYPWGLTVDGSGNVFVADSENSTIRKVTPAGEVTTFAGVAGVSGSANGTGSAARFSRACGVAADSGGNLFVADTYNHLIRKITPAGVVTNFAGTRNIPGSTDGGFGVARLSFPRGLAVSQSGHVFVADTQNGTVRMVTPAGVVSTLGGTPGIISGADGLGSSAAFALPIGIAVGNDGKVYLADTNNHRITFGNPSPPTVTTAYSTNVTDKNCFLNGMVASDGGSAITERGAVFAPTSMNSDPLLGGTSVITVPRVGTTGLVVVPVLGLAASTHYSFRIYATNAWGTGYSPLATFTTQTVYAVWAATNGVSTDPADQGGKNLLAFGLGYPPGGSGSLVYTGPFSSINSWTSSGLPIPVADGADIRAVFERRKDHAAAGLTYTVRFSADLITWEDSAVAPTVLGEDSTDELVSVPYPALVAGQPPRFFVVRVSITP